MKKTPEIIDKTQNIYNARVSAKDNGLAANHACAIAASVRSGMKNGFSFKLITVKSIGEELFVLMPRKTLFGTRQRIIKRPEKWFRYSYNRRRLCNIKVVLPETTCEDITDIDSEGVALACLYENGTASLFVPEWKYDPDSDKWAVSYIEKPCEDSHLAKARFCENIEQLRAAIMSLSDFTSALGLDSETGYLLCGIDELNNRNAGWDEYGGEDNSSLIPKLRRPKLPEKSSHIYNAVSRTPSVGSSWYHSVMAVAEEQGRAEEFRRLAAELTAQQRKAMLFIINES